MGRMTTVICCIAVAAFLGVGVPTAYSEETEIMTKEVSGKVFSIDLKKPSVVIIPETADKTKTAAKVSLDIVNTTAIKEGSEILLLDDLLVGQGVVAKYQENDKNQNIAVEILVE